MGRKASSERGACGQKVETKEEKMESGRSRREMEKRVIEVGKAVTWSSWGRGHATGRRTLRVVPLVDGLFYIIVPRTQCSLQCHPIPSVASDE